jgi:hypothetical protein
MVMSRLQCCGLLIATAIPGLACGGSAHSGSPSDGATTPDRPTSSDGPVAVGVVKGAADMHCIGAGGKLTMTAIGMCSADPGGTDASAPDAAASGASGFGQTMFNTEGDDDDCKYHVSWLSSAIRENTNVMFTTTVTRLVDGQPAKGANVGLAAFLTPTHPTPSPAINNGELPGGQYNIGPVIFDAPGTWTVRFVFYPTCSDIPADSPQGHAAFYVAVP